MVILLLRSWPKKLHWFSYTPITKNRLPLIRIYFPSAEPLSNKASTTLVPTIATRAPLCASVGVKKRPFCKPTEFVRIILCVAPSTEILSAVLPLKLTGASAVEEAEAADTKRALCSILSAYFISILGRLIYFHHLYCPPNPHGHC